MDIKIIGTVNNNNTISSSIDNAEVTKWKFFSFFSETGGEIRKPAVEKPYIFRKMIIKNIKHIIL